MASHVATARRLLSANPALQRAAVVAAKGAAAAAAGGVGLALGLREVKKMLQHETPIDFWKEVSVDVRRSVSASRSSASTASASVPDLCARNALNEEDFWGAASRLRPLELQLEELHAQGLTRADLRRKEDELVKERSYFDPNLLARERATMFGRRLTSDAQGVDIGVLVPTYLPASTSKAGRKLERKLKHVHETFVPSQAMQVHLT
eukprot:s3825_g9.t1